MDKVAAIRFAVMVNGRSKRSVAREFNVGRDTVDRYLAGAEVGQRQPSTREAPKRAVARAKLEALIAATEVAKKQQLTAQRAHKAMRDDGVDVGYSLVKELMAERRRAAKEVFVPLEYAPGELGEVDFFEVVVVIGGERVTAWMFLLRLMSSGRDFCWVYPRQDQVCFLDGHRRAFEFFGGVPERCVYDNLKAAVAEILVGSERKLSARFKEMTDHYALEPCFARPRRGNDKGGVESRGKHVRLQSMVPLPRGDSLDDINRAVLADVDDNYFAKADAASRWALEQQALHAVPWGPFDARKRTLDVAVSSSSTVKVEGATYSVPTPWARQRVTTFVGIDEVELRLGDMSITRRRIARGERDIDYASHYLDELSRKPQAVRQVADTLVTQLGGRFPEVWRRLVDDDGAKEAARKMARILRGIIDLGRDECERRVVAALSEGDALATALLVSHVDHDVHVLVPQAWAVDVESSSVAVFDALLVTGGVQ